MTTSHAATASLVEYALRPAPGGLPDDVTRAGHAIVLDTLAAMIGARAPGLSISAPLLRYAALEGGEPRASIVGWQRRTGPALAAMLNGTFAYALDIESIHGPSITHAAAVVVPAAMAVAEATGQSGAQLLSAIVVGLDVADRVSRAISPRALYARGLHPTAVAGTPAAALTAARLLGLDTAGTLRALGLAASQASGLMAWEHDPTEHSRPFNCGIAARNGVTSALLADAGFGGPEGALEGEGGLLGAFGDARTTAEILSEGLGGRYAVTETQIKRYACCAFLQPGVNAVVQLSNQHGVSAADVDEIALHFPRGGALIVDANPVRSHNAQYVLAVAMHDREVMFDDLIVDRRLTAPDLAALSQRVRVVHSVPLDPEFPDRYTSQVVLTLRGGQRLETVVTYPVGHPRNPLSPADLRAKVERLAVPVVGEATTAALIAEVEGLWQAASVESLMALLRTEPIQAAAGATATPGVSA